MSNLDRGLIALVALGLWALALAQLRDTPVQASNQTLTRYDVTAAVRDALRENPSVSRADVQTILVQTLSRCTISGRLTEGEATADDSTDFIAHIRC